LISPVLAKTDVRKDVAPSAQLAVLHGLDGVNTGCRERLRRGREEARRRRNLEQLGERQGTVTHAAQAVETVHGRVADVVEGAAEGLSNLADRMRK